jgi:hypothetical protein
MWKIDPNQEFPVAARYKTVQRVPERQYAKIGLGSVPNNSVKRSTSCAVIPPLTTG